MGGSLAYINATNVMNRNAEDNMNRSDDHGLCAVLHLMNLARVQWAFVGCKVKVFSDVFCYVDKTKMEHSNITANKHFCRNGAIMKNHSCFLLLLKETNLQIEREACCSGQKCHSPVLSILQYLTSVISGNLPPVYLCASKKLLMFLKYTHIIVQTTQNTSDSTSFHAIHMGSMVPTVYTIGGNMLSCDNSTHTTITSLCDEQFDCKDLADEQNILCSAMTTNYKNTIRPPCPLLMYTTHQHQCRMYSLSIKLDTSDNDSAKRNGNCLSIGQLSCGDDQQECYNVSQICSYQVSGESRLTPCSKGNHLASCKQFECNIWFKCQDFYCIPQAYVCNGKWDCPRGVDEVMGCGNRQECPHLFRCKGTRLCVHLSGTCDSVPNCPLWDDELFCHLSEVSCPENCQCLAFAIECRNASMTSFENEILFHFAFVLFNEMTFVSELERMSFVQSKPVLTVFMTLHNCKIYNPCVILSAKNAILALDWSKNGLLELDKDCFEFSSKTKQIDLSLNLLSFLHASLFQNLSGLLLLNLSSNPVSNFLSSSRTFSAQLKVLSLHGNKNHCYYETPISSLFFDVLETNDFRLCCHFQQKLFCTAKKPWFAICSDLLPNFATKIAYSCISVALFFVNVGSIIVHSLAVHKSWVKMNVFTFVIIAANSLDLYSSAPFWILWAADFVYNEGYILFDTMWRSHTFCFLTCTLFTSTALISPSLVCLIAISRFMIVVNPFDSKFKTTKYVLRQIACIMMLGLLISISFVFCLHLESKNMGLPLSLCSPFADPGNVFVGITAAVFLVCILQPTSALVSIGLFIGLIVSVKTSQRKVSSATTTKSSCVSLVIQLTILSLSNIISWFPSNTIHVSLWFLPQYPLPLAWGAVGLTSVNAMVYPVVFVSVSFRKWFRSKQSVPVAG